ncbi:MAG: GntR family transcriptional regulator [Lachnospiraceae bacterium]|nr:GntR family transcriptional regulator [Lachnospiraceae bacterium]
MCLKAENPKMICTELLKEMRNGLFSQCKKLPRETVLSEKLGISRTQLRDVLSDFEREGFITRRHGVGTIINRHVLEVKSRMDIETEFLDIIRQNGHEATISFIQVTERIADGMIAQKLHIEEGTPVICIRLLCNADDRPAIYSEDVLEKHLVKADYRSQDFKLSIFQFLEKFCDVEPYMDLTELHPVLADEKLSKILQVSKGSPLLNMEEVDYDIEGNPIFYSKQYFVDRFFKHTVLRKKF